MIVGIGVDIIEVERIRSALERHGDRFVRRLFTDEEAAYCRRAARPAERFAARFAAKEAALKALGVGWQAGTRLLDVTVANDEMGAPSLTLHGRSAQIAAELGVTRIHLSLSHQPHFAIAQVVLEG
jgi:holo-[acyl-carrier protein] synthase